MQRRISVVYWRFGEKKAGQSFIFSIHRIRHSLFHPANEGHSFKEIAKPLDEETVIQKKVNSSFIGTNLEEQLRSNEIDTVVIAGLTTPHCVSTTTRMSGNLGFETYLMSDATAAFGLADQTGTYYDPETIHRLSLATLHDEFATVLTTRTHHKLGKQKLLESSLGAFCLFIQPVFVVQYLSIWDLFQ